MGNQAANSPKSMIVSRLNRNKHWGTHGARITPVFESTNCENSSKLHFRFGQTTIGPVLLNPLTPRAYTGDFHFCTSWRLLLLRLKVYLQYACATLQLFNLRQVYNAKFTQQVVMIVNCDYQQIVTFLLTRPPRPGRIFGKRKTETLISAKSAE